MVFFPSYKMLVDVTEVYEEQYGTVPNVEVLRQSPSMGEKEREAFLEAFQADREGTLIGCCVMGGIFAEGIDLVGDRLIGALIVGTGLPQISHERKILMDYYDKKGESGFDYAYRYPGMNKVLQAAGRVIRTPEDRGAVLLLDDRFARPDYARLFPPHWQHIRYLHSAEELGQALQDFWQK